jgi:hypothetical protein
MQWLNAEIQKAKTPPVKKTKQNRRKLPDYGVEIKNMPDLFGMPLCK